MSSKNKSMRSIARSINMEFWLREFLNLLFLDLVIAAAVMIGFALWFEGSVAEGEDIAARYFSSTDDWMDTLYVVQVLSGETFEYPLYNLYEIFKIPAIIILGAEGIILFGNIFATGKVRKKMKPLNEVAIRTEALSRDKSLNSEVNLRRMEQAVSRVNPDMPGAKVTTGNKELQSLEIAINNLLERMRESHRQQERFVSDASHELRTPIAVIQGYVNMLDRWGKDDEQILNESIEALKNESEHMKNLVEQLLFLARGDSGRNALNLEDVDLCEVVRDVMEESEMIDAKHKYIFEETAGKQAVIVKCDLAMIKQSLRIFVQNASKYSEEGNVITLKAGIKEGQPFYSVQDEGSGMKSSEVVHVFERFYRSDGARNSDQGGTGLGLSIAKWIVDAHDGVIEILSRPEFGTRITVKLPKQ